MPTQSRTRRGATGTERNGREEQQEGEKKRKVEKEQKGQHWTTKRRKTRAKKRARCKIVLVLPIPSLLRSFPDARLSFPAARYCPLLPHSLQSRKDFCHFALTGTGAAAVAEHVDGRTLVLSCGVHLRRQFSPFASLFPSLSLSMCVLLRFSLL